MRVPGMPAPLFYADETRSGRWAWQLSITPSMIASAPRSAGTFKQLLNEVAEVSKLNPRALLLFNFAEGQTCKQLNVLREPITEAGGCSKSAHCVQGTPAQLP
jgi:hypothetical protein